GHGVDARSAIEKDPLDIGHHSAWHEQVDRDRSSGARSEVKRVESLAAIEGVGRFVVRLGVGEVVASAAAAQLINAVASREGVVPAPSNENVVARSAF